MPTEKDAQRALAQRLVGRRVRWAHRTDLEMTVLRATEDGMVEITDFVGEFSPTGFVVVDDERSGGGV